jgi:enediyne biosynthesis protein E4
MRLFKLICTSRFDTVLRSHVILAAFFFAMSGCDSSPPEQPAAPQAVPPEIAPLESGGTLESRPVSAPTIRFADVTSDSGIEFQWSGGPTSQHCMPEQNGGGIALFDYDNDTLADVVLTDCGVFDGSGPQDAAATWLFRNQGDCRFTEVSLRAGLPDIASAMGAAAGDFNSDGFTDLFVACFGENLLYINRGDGTFSNETTAAGIEGSQWSCSAAVADLNGDGLLDIYVANYVDWRPDSPPCHNSAHPELRQICSPAGFNAEPDSLYINLGNGSFEDRGVSAGVAENETGKGLAVEIADFSEDGQLDVFVANDTTRNSLFINHGDLQFVDSAVAMGVAVSSDGTHGASMGTASADFDRDSHLDLFVTNFRNQVNDLYSGTGEAGFIPAGSFSGINLSSRDKLAFGAVFRDFDMDGWPDLFIANGHIWDLTAVSSHIDYQMHPDILRNLQGRTFENVRSTAGSYFANKWLGRSVAAGDLDGDAIPDLVIQHVGAPTAILKNVSPLESRGILLTIVGSAHCRNALGCRVTVSSAGIDTVSCIPSGGSFQASHDSRLTLAVPESGTIDLVSIVWPDASKSVWRQIDVSRAHNVVLIEGAAAAYLLPD